MKNSKRQGLFNIYSIIYLVIFLFSFNDALFAQQSSGTIIGQVVDASTGQPIAGATIDVMLNNRILDTTFTDQNGNYTVSGLAPNSYIVRASATNYQTAMQGAIVQAGQTTSANFALQSNPGGIEGQVKDASTGKPIAGAIVKVMLKNLVMATTKTNKDGNYTVDGLPPNSNYIFIASAPSFQTAMQGVMVEPAMRTPLPSRLEINPAVITGQVLDAVTGQPVVGATVEFIVNDVIMASTITDQNGNYTLSRLTPNDFINIVRVSATNYQTEVQGAPIQSGHETIANFFLNLNPGSISGNVADALTSQPVVGATVEFMLDNVIMGTTLTDQNGNYISPGLPDGNYVVRVSATNYQTAMQGATVQAGQETTVNVLLKLNPGTASGQVLDASTNTPIVGAMVDAMLNSVIMGTAMTDQNGNYALSGLTPDNNYMIKASATNFQTSMQGASVQPGQETRVIFTLQPSVGSIVGQVVDASTGQPLEAVVVEATLHNLLMGNAMTDQNGNYTLSGLASGDYIVKASMTNYQTAMQGATVQVNQATIVNFALQPNPVNMVGQVVDAVTGQPIAGAIVDVMLNNVVMGTVMTDQNGNYTLSGLAPNQYEVRASATNYQTVMQVDQTTSANFALQSNPGSITGRVVDASTGQPIVSAIVDVMLNNLIMATTMTNQNGNYTLFGLASGNYVVRVSATNYQTAIQAVTVQTGQTTTANFALQLNPGSVNGKVTNALTHEPVIGAFIEAFLEGNLIATAMTDANGFYNLTGLAPGLYSIVASATNFQSLTKQANVQEGQTTTLNFSLIPTNALPPSPPRHLTGKVIENRFATQTDRIHRLKWKASLDPAVVSYRIYREGKLIAKRSAHQRLRYTAHNRSKKRATYQVTAVNALGQESEPVSVRIK